MATQHETLLDLLLERADPGSASAGSPAFSFYENGEDLSGSLSFGELDSRARNIASHLQEIARPGDRILLVMPPGLDYIVSFFACIYAGVIAVPAVPPSNARTYPRLKLICRDAAARAALTLADIAERLEGYDQLAEADDAAGAMRWIAADRIDDGARAWRRPALATDDIAFLQYTSGSTGAPKGVMVSHGNIMANTRLIHAAFNIAPSEVVVSWLPPHHDMGLIGKILYPVFAGCHAVHMSPSAFLKRPHRWLGLIARYRASITGGPNFAFELCTRKITAAQKEGLDLSSLRFALNGAEAIRVETLDNFAAAFAGCGLRPEAITPVYGLAESTLLVTANLSAGRATLDLPTVFSKSHLAQDVASVAGYAGDGQALVSLGAVPDATHQVVIASPDSAAPVAPGQIGEICIAGPSVAHGYWQKAELNASVFVDGLEGHPVRFLRTGDLGFLHEGSLFFAGRIKEMMVFGGRNIYPQDVEAAIEKLDPAFRANGCAVFSVDEGVDAQLVIVQEIETRQQPDLTGLHGKMAAELGEQFEIINIGAVYLVKPGSIPRTSSGKLQRLRCKSLHASGELVSLWEVPVAGRAAPAGAAGEQAARFEEQLLQIWRELLDVDALSRDDNFFAMGGHSLLATQAVSKIGAAFGLELPLRALFEAPTVAALAQHLATGAASAPAAPPILPLVRSQPLPLSFAQQRLWFLDQLQTNSAFYNIPGALRLTGTLDRDALARALGEIMRRHEILRTTFVQVDGSPVQQIAPPAPLPLPLIDVSTAPDPRQAIRDQMRAAASAPFDLARGPLIRAGLLRVTQDEHVLLLTLHHIVIDGWSMGVMRAEIGSLYGAYAAQQPSPLPELAIQYADYAHWQRQWLAGDVLDRQLDYWTGQLGGAPSLLTLPTDRPRPAVQSFRGASLPFHIDAPTAAALAALSQHTHSTLFMTLMAAFQAFLARYTGQDDISVGTPIANRNRAEIEPLIGCFINTLVMRSQVRPHERFLDLLDQVRGTALGAYAHQDIPFEQLVDALQPERHLGHTPLFQVMLVLQNTPQGDISLPGLTAAPLAAENTAAKFDLLLELMETDGGLAGSVEYSTDLFDAATIERMADHFKRLLQAVAADPTLRISELPMLSDAEHQQLLAWNDTGAVFNTTCSGGDTLHQRIEAQAVRTPDAIALVFEHQQLSYGGLNAHANQLAHRLRTLGVGPDRLVALCAERSIDMVVGLLAILKAGGAYIPLDPAYPAERLAYMLDDAQPTVLLTQRHLLDTLPAHALPCVCLEDGGDGQPDTNPGALAGPQHLAYVIYTSGSTGKPKGAAIAHAGIVNRLDWMQQANPLMEADRVLQKTPYSFDVSVWEFFWPLREGATLVLAKPGGHQNPQYLADLMGSQRITTVHFVPPMLDTFLRVVPDGWQHALRQVICSGEALPFELQQRFFARFPQQVALHNLYGPTEASVEVTWHTCQSGADGGTVPIGRPIANIQIHIVDASLNPVPVGVAGELYIAGIGLARGYLNRPGLSAEKFIPNPFSAQPGARMYRSGDLARRLPDGAIEYLGRIDNQVKIRGFRIELGEIEAAVAALPGVRESVVLAREDQPGDKRLVAYLVPDTASDIDLAGLRAALLRSLPDYMVPSHTLLLDALPLTANGKIDRKALPAPDTTRSETGYVAPATPTEGALVEIWAEVLALDKVGIHDNFFALGGHSLLAIKMIERARRAGLHTDVTALFQSPTIAELAVTVVAAEHSATIAPNAIPAGCSHITPDMLPLVTLEPAEISVIAASVAGGHANIEDIYPLAPLQDGMLFHHLKDGAKDPYLLWNLVSFDSRAQVDAFVTALTATTGRHDVLRTSFVWEGVARPVQVVWRRAELTTEELRIDEGIDDPVEWLARQPVRLDVTTAPVLRLRTLFDARNERWLMQMLCHHLVMDHITMELMFGEIQQIMAGRLDSLPAPVPYRNFVAQGLLSLYESDSEAFFKTTLSDVDERTAPFGLTDVKGDGSVIDEFRSTIDAGLAQRLRAHARAHNVSVASLMHLAWARVLAVLTGKRDVVFGTVLLGRSHGSSSVERGLGLFINTLPIRLHVADGSVAQGLKHAHDALAGLLRHEHASLALALSCSGLAPSVPLFSTLFNFRHSRRLGEHTAEWDGTTSLASNERSNYPLNLFVDDLGEDFMLTVQAVSNPALGAEGLCTYVRTILEQLDAALTHEPDRRLSSLDALSDAARQQLLDWNDSTIMFPVTDLLHRRFDTQASHAYVLDDALQLLPAGVIGNLHLAGADLPHDFLSQDGLSPQHFAANPFHPGSDERLFDTGQLARRLPDGSIELHGPRDQHAVVHGIRISLAQASAALQALPQVQQAVVLVHDALPADKRLVAHVVAAPGVTLSSADWPALRSSLQATLPEYMLPQRVVLHDALPLAPTGSIDRDALAATAAADSELPFLAPASATEVALAGMWRELLPVDQVSMHDNFFALGGNSLSVVVLSNLVEQHFALQVPIDVFFNAQTLLQISRHIDELLPLNSAQRAADALSDDYATLTI